MFYFFAFIIGYLIGSVPPGYFYVKWATGKNVLAVGSGRTGGTNCYRAAGLKVGIATGLTDILKGAIAVWVVLALLEARVPTEEVFWLQGLAGIGAVTGHNWSIYLGFKGGAGTTPNIGWVTAIWWPLLPLLLVIVLGMYWLTGMASVMSLLIGILIPLIFGVRYLLVNDPSPAYLICSLITCILVTWSLRPNIQRLLEGNERIVGPRARRKNKEARQQSG